MDTKGGMENMKKRWRLYGLCLLSVCLMTACQKSDPEAKQDFWTETIEVLEEASKAKSYDSNAWEIGIQDASVVSDADHRSVHITWKDVNNAQETFSFSLENYGKPSIVYSYKKTMEADAKTIQDIAVVRSTDTAYQVYRASYQRNVYQDDICIDSTQQEVDIQIKDNRVEYENIPYLKEVMDKGDKLLTAFQKEFGIEYAKNGFVNLPAMIKDTNIVSMIDELETNASYTSYYSLPQINAKGHSLITSLDVKQDYSSVIYQVYDVEGQGYETRNMALEATSIENLYNMIPDYDAEVLYAVYFDGEAAYLYSQKQPVQEIYEDVQQGAVNALTVLNTSNPSGESYGTAY